MTDKENELKLLWTDTEDWITCEIYWYCKDWICYVKDVINKRTEEREVKVWRCNCECWWHNIKSEYKYCPDCWWKIVD